jgi:hypothetical protein
MALVASASGDMWQVRLQGRQEGQETNNVLHFVTAGAAADVETTLILAMAECFVEQIIPHLAASWKLEQIRWKKVAPALGPEYITVPPGTLTGGVIGPSYPSFVAGLLSIHTLLGGRSHRGRMFIAGLPESAAPNSVIVEGSDFAAALIAFVNCIATKFINIGDPAPASSYRLGVYSRKLGGSAFPYGAAGFTAVAQIVPELILATMRSRKVGRGS